jgi:hypothetical protein
MSWVLPLVAHSRSKEKPMPSRRNTSAFTLLFLFLSGCLTEARVLTMESGDDGGATMQNGDMFGNAGAAEPGVVIMEPAPGIMQPAATGMDPVDLDDRIECSDEAIVLLDELDEIYGLAVTSSSLYAGTYTGVLRSTHDGADRTLVVDEFVQRVLADEQWLYWGTGSLDLNVQGADGESEPLLRSHGSIEGVSQDQDAIYALSDGYLVRIDKTTRQVEPLVDGTRTTPLHWSGTAVDEDFVYFVSYGDAGTDLERVRKDGSTRELVTAQVGQLMEVLTLLVDEGYVYVASQYGIRRVLASGGGMIEPVSRTSKDFGYGHAMAVDADCLYYIVSNSLLCWSKAKRSAEHVFTVVEGNLTALAVRGPDLFIGASNTGPAFAPNGWIGRLQCMPED